MLNEVKSRKAGKKLIIISSLFLVMACNNSGNKPDSQTNDTTHTETDQKQIDQPSASVDAGACGKMIFFQPGAEIEATSYDEEGKEISKQYTKILSVTNEGGFTVANVEGKDTDVDGEKQTTTVNYNYKCDGNKIYFDVASMFRTAEKEKDASFESSLIEYPINVKEGEVLPDATGIMNSMRDGKKTALKFIYKNRKVEGMEKITTPAGTWNCYKLSNSVESEMDIPGMDEKAKEMMKKMQEGMKMTTTTWFAPDFGIVKMEMYMNGKLQSRNEVTSVKK
jgi:hypothetical protein